jgi:ABC-type iron transport system FetAB permease component
LNSLTNVVKENGIAPGNLVQLDQTVSFAIEQQTSLMVNTTDASLREESCKNFTISVIDLNGVVLGNASAFWGLNWEARSEAISEVQKNVDDTLFLLAENLLDKMYQYGNISDQNIGNNIAIF